MPVPVLTITGHAAVIENVRYTWMDHCLHCRQAVNLYTDGGTIAVGIIARSADGKPRWYQRYESNARPVAPDQCPLCGADDPFPAGMRPRAFTNYDPSPRGEAWRLLSGAFDTIRAEHLDLALKADGRRHTYTINGRKV